MTTARPVRPTDLVALVSFDGTVYPHEAHTWDRLGRAALEARVMRLFLRAEAGSEVLPAAHKAGFMPAAREWLLQLAGDTAGAALDAGVELRDRRRTDGFPLFRLYNLLTPIEVCEQ